MYYQYAPWAIQILLAPVTAFFAFYVFIFGESAETTRIFIGLTSFSAIFAGLSLSGYSAKLDDKASVHFKKASFEFLQATLMGATGVVFNFCSGWLSENGWPYYMTSYLSIGSGLTYATGLLAAHLAIWSFTKGAFRFF